MGPTLLLRFFGALCPSRRTISVSARFFAGFLAPAVAVAGTLASCGGNTGLTAPASFENPILIFFCQLKSDAALVPDATCRPST